MSHAAAVCIICGIVRNPRRGRKPVRPGKCVSCQTIRRPHVFDCATCGKHVSADRNSGRPRQYCSRGCRELAQAKIVRMRRQAELRSSGKTLPGDILECALPKCDVRFMAKTSHQRYCSRRCREVSSYGPYATGEVLATRIRIEPCARCHETLVIKHGRGYQAKQCLSCRREVQRLKDAQKNHARRAAGRDVLSVDQLAARDGSRCQICRRKIDLSRSGQDQWGPSIDHILPVSRGGTNDPANLRLAHRRCNSSRGAKQPAQMLLGVA